MKMSCSQLLHLPVCAQFSLCTIQIALHSTGPGTLCHEMCDIIYLTMMGARKVSDAWAQGAGPLSLNHVLLIAVLWGVDFFKVCAWKMKESGEWMLGRKPLVPRSRVSFFFSWGLSSCRSGTQMRRYPLSSSFLSAHPALSFCFSLVFRATRVPLRPLLYPECKAI